MSKSKKFKVSISGVTPHLVDAKHKRAAVKQTYDKWGNTIKDHERTVVVTEWRTYTTHELAEALLKMDNVPVCIPSSGGTANSQFLPTVKGIVEVETMPMWKLDVSKEKPVKMVCLETHVISSNVS